MCGSDWNSLRNIRDTYRNTKIIKRDNSRRYSSTAIKVAV